MYKEFSPAKEELILSQPILTRIFHWVLFFSVSILIFTGFYIHTPGWLKISMKTVRLWHSISAYILLANLISNIYYYYFVTKYYHTVVFKFKDIKHLVSFFKYYLFFRPDHPYYGKYNPGQKMVITIWFLLIIFMIITGFPLYYPSSLQFMRLFIGDLGTIRLLHYLGFLGLTSTIPIHLYLVFTEDPAKLQAMFTGYIKK